MRKLTTLLLALGLVLGTAPLFGGGASDTSQKKAKSKKSKVKKTAATSTEKKL